VDKIWKQCYFENGLIPKEFSLKFVYIAGIRNFLTHDYQKDTIPEFELEAELSRAVGATVQVIFLNTPLTPVFGFEIMKDGIVLIDRNPNLRVEFENRILRQYYDWQYFLKRQMGTPPPIPGR